MKKTEKKNKIMIILLSIFLLILIGFNFFTGESKLTFSSNLILVILIVTVLVLAEEFDNLSIGKILSLNRKIKNKEKELNKEKKENDKLRNNIIQLSSNLTQNQKQTHTTINGIPADLLKNIPGVVKNDEKENDFDEIQNKNNFISTEEYLSVIKKDVFNKFINKYNLKEDQLIRDVKFSSVFEGVDPIMKGGETFDAYLKKDNKELFIEIMINNRIHPSYYRLYYVNLSKIYYYRQAKGNNAKFLLLLVDAPGMESEDEDVRRAVSTERFLEKFQSAISNKLLKTETFYFNKDDCKKWEEDIKLKKFDK